MIILSTPAQAIIHMQYFIDITSAMSGLLVAFVPKLQLAVERHAEVAIEHYIFLPALSFRFGS
mgnify:CR=1 FL=1